jgi:hypothetical protein
LKKNLYAGLASQFKKRSLLKTQHEVPIVDWEVDEVEEVD